MGRAGSMGRAGTVGLVLVLVETMGRAGTVGLVLVVVEMGRAGMVLSNETRYLVVMNFSLWGEGLYLF